jgi:predicted kinase/HD superfamily phosphodiesterase
MRAFDLIKKFQELYPQQVQDMKACEHNYVQGDVLVINPYHAEDVWTHTCMVLLMAEQIKANDKVMVAALLHDLGKPLARETIHERQRNRFIGHEGLSVFMAIDFLNTTTFSKEEKSYVLKLISLHTSLYKEMEKEGWEQSLAENFIGEEDFLKDLISLTYVDSQGRFAEDKVVVTYSEFYDKFQKTFEIMKTLDKKQISSNKSVTVLVGPPNAGKSTFLKGVPKGLILSRDQVILDLAGHGDYTKAFKEMDVEKVDKEFQNRIKESHKSSEEIFFDMTAMSPKSRRRLLGSFGADYNKKAIVFLTTPTELLKRNKERMEKDNKYIPEKVIFEMMKNFTIPMKFEGFSSVEVIFT